MKSGVFRIRGWMRSELLHDWIQSIGILIAAAWAVYTFLYKDVLVPRWKPALLNLEASLTPVPGRESGSAGADMILEIVATNPSTHKVHLLSSTWWITGLDRRSRQQPLDLPASDHLSRSDYSHIERAMITQPGALLAVGKIFGDDYIDAGETIRRTFLVRIPRAIQASGGVEIQANVVSMFREPGAQLFAGRLLVLAPGSDNAFQPILCDNQDPPRCTQPTMADVDQQLKRFDSRWRLTQLSKQVGLPPPPER